MDNQIIEKKEQDFLPDTFPQEGIDDTQTILGKEAVESWVKDKVGSKVSPEAVTCYAEAALKGLSTGTTAYKVGQWLDAVITPGVGTGAAILIGSTSAATKARQCYLEEKARQSPETGSQSLYLEL